MRTACLRQRGIVLLLALKNLEGGGRSTNDQLSHQHEYWNSEKQIQERSEYGEESTELIIGRHQEVFHREGGQSNRSCNQLRWSFISSSQMRL